MNSIYIFIRKRQNVSYFYSKLFILFIIFSLWLLNTKFFSGESNLYLSIALLIALFSTLEFGIIFKNHLYKESIIGIHVFIDVINTFIFIFLSSISQPIFIFISILLLSQINLFLAKKLRPIFDIIYFLFLLAMLFQVSFIFHNESIINMARSLFFISIFI